MPDKPLSDKGVSDWLKRQFGGSWMLLEGGAGGIPGARLWSQFQPDPDGRLTLVGMLLIADGITADRLRKIPVGVLEDAASQAGYGGEEQLRATLAKLPPLKRGDLSAAEFSGLVAEHYKAWVRHTSRPAAAMARESGEKGPTVHGWIREARLRGLLPEAERGKRARG